MLLCITGSWGAVDTGSRRGDPATWGWFTRRETDEMAPFGAGGFLRVRQDSHGAISTALRHIPHLVSELLCLKCAFLLSSFQTYEELRVPKSGMKFTDGKAPLISQAEGPWLVVFLGPSQKGRLGEGRDM